MTKYSRDTREAAYKLYATGMPALHVCKKLGLSTQTLYRWMRQDGWQGRMQKNEEEVLKKANETIIEIKERQNKVVSAIIAQFIRQLQKNPEKQRINSSDVISALKHQLHLFGEAETSVREERDPGADAIDYDQVRKDLKKILDHESKPRKPVNNNQKD